MRIIKVFNDFINEELSPLTIYNTAQKLKEKGHKNRYFNLKNISNIFNTSKNMILIIFLLDMILKRLLVR